MIALVHRAAAASGQLKRTVRHHLLVVDRQPQFVLAIEVPQRVAV